MGLSFAQALGTAADQWNQARQQKLAESIQQQQLAMSQQQLAKSVEMEMVRNAIAQRQLTSEEGRYATEQERVRLEQARLEASGWQKNAPYQRNGKWYILNNYTGQEREVGDPMAVVNQTAKGTQALDLEKQRNKDKLEQIAAQGRWHMQWAQLAAQGRLSSQAYQKLRLDPGYQQAMNDMKSAIAERNGIIARLYSTTNPPNDAQAKLLQDKLSQIEQQLQNASKSAEQVRNRVMFGSNVSDLKNFVQQQVGPARPSNVPKDYIYRSNGSRGAGWYKPGTS
jgi:hypothetical protein